MEPAALPFHLPKISTAHFIRNSTRRHHDQSYCPTVPGNESTVGSCYRHSSMSSYATLDTAAMGMNSSHRRTAVSRPGALMQYTLCIIWGLGLANSHFVVLEEFTHMDLELRSKLELQPVHQLFWVYVNDVNRLDVGSTATRRLLWAGSCLFFR
jgi:hypothetical protein